MAVECRDIARKFPLCVYVFRRTLPVHSAMDTVELADGSSSLAAPIAFCSGTPRSSVVIDGGGKTLS